MGAFIMIVGVVLMIIIHEGGHFIAAKAFGMKATEAFFGFGPRIWSTTKGETEYGVKAIPFGGYVRIIGMNPFEEIPEEEEERTYRAAPYWKKSVVVLAGIASHFVVAFLLLWLVGVVWGTLATDDNGDLVRTTTVAAVSEFIPGTDTASPAALAGTEDGDVIRAVDATQVAEWDEFVSYVADRPGEDVTVTVERDGERVALAATLAAVERAEFDDEGNVITDSNGDPVTNVVGFYGVTPEALRESYGPIAMVPVAIGQFWDVVVQSVRGLWEMIIGFPELLASLFGGDDEILDTVRPISPIGLVQLAGPIESTLQLLAFVNIFVGVLNFVPLYPLDGGHFAVATYEKITGRVPNVERLLPVAAIVFVFLVSIGLIGIYLDIFQPIQ